MLLPAGPPAKAADQAQVMIVLDASGSMWGQIDGRPKIDIAREAVASLLADWDPSIHLGLSAYGHRTKGDCNDIQTLQPIGPVNPTAIMRAVTAIRPKGKTPLSEAVLRAARELRYTEERATVILVSDGIETCEMDPCELGKALEANGVGFTTHVIGFDVKKEEQASLRCLAENTGGAFFAAENAAGLNDALETTVVKVKEAAVQPAPAPPPPPKVTVVEPPKVVQAPAPVKTEPVIPPGHHFVAVLADGSPPIAKGMRWDVYHAAKDADGKRKHVRGTYDSKPTFKLQAGRYHMVVKAGNAVTKLDFEARSVDDRVRHTVIMNAGLVKLAAVLKEGQQPYTKGMRWDVYSATKNLEGKRRHFVGTYDGSPLFTLNAGKYHIVSKNGKAITTQDVEIVAGKRVEGAAGRFGLVCGQIGKPRPQVAHDACGQARIHLLLPPGNQEER